MSARVRDLLRQNVIGLVALFVALGGTATALTGKNTVDSGDIKDDQVKSADVRDDTLSGGGLAAADLNTDSVGTSEITSGAVGSDELQDSVVFGTEGLMGEANISLDADGIRVRNQFDSVATIDENGNASFSELTAKGFQTTGAFSATEDGPFDNPAQNQVILFARDQGGLTQLVAQFADGDIDVLAQEAP